MGCGVIVDNADLCVVRLGKGERMNPCLASILEEVDITSIHYFTLPPEGPAELHYHDFEDYWLFLEGSITVKLRLEDGRMTL